MATRFELVLYGNNRSRLRAAGEEALGEIERLAAQLSFYAPDSEIHHLNTHAAITPVRVNPRLFSLLKSCAELTKKTDGTFDVTIGPLMRAWRFVNEKGALPTEEEIAQALSQTGMKHVLFDEETCSVQFDHPGIEIDLGGYGKGYAIERALESLRENGVTNALLHGGTSSITTIGSPPNDAHWKIALQPPLAGTMNLKNDAMSVSAVHGKSFIVDGRVYGHVLNPKNGWPVNGAQAAVVQGISASVCEALSTALLVKGADWLPQLAEYFPGYVGLVAS